MVTVHTPDKGDVADVTVMLTVGGAADTTAGEITIASVIAKATNK
jgi:hypothetical protein